MYRRFTVNYLVAVATVLTCLANPQLASAQLEAPDILCASVNDNGTVDITWEAPPDPDNEFFNYEIFFDDGSGFQSLGYWGGINNTTYTHFGINATDQSYSYWLQTLYAGGNGVSSPSDTISTLQLELTSESLSSVAVLEWNDPGNDIENSSDGSYYIMREYPPGDVQEVAQVPIGTYTYKDTLFGLCVEDPVSVDYWVELRNSECTSRSDVETDEFQDLLGPGVPEVETITVNQMTNEVEIYWEDVNAPDLEEYLIQRVNILPNPDEFINVGTKPAGEGTFFVYGTPPGDQAFNMVVIAFDSCGNDNSYDDIASTMYLRTDYDECNLEVLLNWSDYDGWDEGVSKYEIVQSQDGGTDQVIAELGPEAETYRAEVEPFSDYCYYVRAISNGDQIPSSSNGKCITASYPDFSEVNYLSTVTREIDGSTRIQLHTDGTGDSTEFQLQSSKGAPDDFETIATVSQPAPGTDLTYTVPPSATNTAITYYRWRQLDACGAEANISNESSTMEVRAVADVEELRSRITWNPYVNWDGDVEEYRIYRRFGNEGNFELVATVGGNKTSYQETVEEYLLEEGNFCYRIEAVESPNSYGFSKSAFSSVGCATQEPLIWIPNTLLPNSDVEENTTFKPVAGFLDFDRYQMVILNKWNQEIFSTEDIEEPWDGTYNGQLVPSGVYFYFISFYDGAGNNYSRRGEIYVLY